MKLFKLPDLGEGLKEAEIVTWHAKVDEEIKKGDPLVSVETDKAIVEIPAPESSWIIKCFGDEGDIVQVGDPLVEFDSNGSKESSDSGTVVGEVKTGDEVVKERAVSIGGKKESVGVRVTPAVRALASRLGVDLSIVTPTGPKGSISVADIQRVAKILTEVGPMEPLRGVRRAMARTMAQSHAEVVPVTIHDVADIHDWSEDTDISCRIIQAIITGCKTEPSLNAWYDSHAIGRRLLKHVDLGLAVDTDDGLFVPVIKDIGQYTTDQLRSKLDETKSAVADRSILPAALRGHTFTLSNFGTIAGRYANPVVVPPAVSILGVGHAYEAVVAENDAAVVHRLLPLSLSFDHRAVTGGEAGRFLGALIDSLQTREL